MATSSITKNFVISGRDQVEQFANAIEESYQESLRSTPSSDLNVTFLRGTDDVKEFLSRKKKVNA